MGERASRRYRFSDTAHRVAPLSPDGSTARRRGCLGVQPVRMPTLLHDVWLRGGVSTTAELRMLGYTAREIARAAEGGGLLRVSRGVFALPQLDPLELVALRAGGRLTGTAGAQRHGIWAPHHQVIDVAVEPHARSPRPQAGIQLRIDWSARREPGTRSLVGPAGCLIRLSHVEDTRPAFVALESALHAGCLTLSERERVVASAPRRMRRFLARAVAASESGGESLLSFGLIRAGIPFTQQVDVPGVGRVDVIIGGRLVVEIDGAEFHTGREAFERDRRRDALLVALGYRVLRFSYLQVLHRWDEVERAIRAAVGRGDHRC